MENNEDELQKLKLAQNDFIKTISGLKEEVLQIKSEQNKRKNTDAIS
jgi:hypothetical protein